MSLKKQAREPLYKPVNQGDIKIINQNLPENHVETSQAQILDNGEDGYLLRRLNLAGHLEADLDDFEWVREYDLRIQELYHAGSNPGALDY